MKKVIWSAALLCSLFTVAADSYNTANNQLTIPSIAINGIVFNGVVITVGNVVTVGSANTAPFSGSWQNSATGTGFNITQNGNIISVALTSGFGSGQSAAGVVNGNTVSVTGGSFSWQLTILDASSMQLTQLACGGIAVPGLVATCTLANGVSYLFTKK